MSFSDATPKNIFSFRPYWAKRFGISPVLPTSREEMDELGWDSCDIIIVTGDAYIDHPSFGMALIGRLLEAQGFRVGIIAQPDWKSTDAFTQLGQPNLYFGITAGNMDSMVNRYTSERKIRHNDAYTPDGAEGKRPDRSVAVYSHRCREAFSNTPIIIGGIEASLRRIAHYDYWSDKVRRSVLFDAKADLLIYGNAERAIVEVSHQLANNINISDIRDVRGTAYIARPGDQFHTINHDQYVSAQNETTLNEELAIRLPSFDQVKENPELYAIASRLFHQQTNPGNAKAIVQKHTDRDLFITPPPFPLSTQEMDKIYELPYTRQPHPSYNNAKIPAFDMIKFSVTIMRGCFGGCTFCSITEHEGRIIQSRSEKSILNEIKAIKDESPGFTGQISDIGGPTANMYRMKCDDKEVEKVCKRLSCVYPKICSHLNTDHTPLINLYKKARKIDGIKKINIASGLRYDLAIRSPEYIKELATHHVGGYLKIAPEHTEENTLQKMMKPGIDSYYEFKKLFEQYSAEAGKEQYLIPYFIAAHPGSTDESMLNLALWLKQNNFRLDQVQTFLPTPMALASAMYHSELNPLKKLTKNTETVYSAKGAIDRRIQKAFLRYHDAQNWPILRDKLKQMNRSDLIGNGQQQLIPSWQPEIKQPVNKNRKTKQKKYKHWS
ncbi:MAG: YgiQ family radical SAM protein [Methylococcales bacterium]|jgi:uncharacterized radical SAM protein YgiQ|nr:YgiQ family radical SAM protein [Methylococcales bacterium]